jgi:hypothetical protein
MRLRIPLSFLLAGAWVTCSAIAGSSWRAHLGLQYGPWYVVLQETLFSCRSPVVFKDAALA